MGNYKSTQPAYEVSSTKPATNPQSTPVKNEPVRQNQYASNQQLDLNDSITPAEQQSGRQAGVEDALPKDAKMSEIKKLVQEIGVVDLEQDEYDIPTFLRKQAN